MPLEDAQFIAELNPANPPNPDPAAEGAAQIRETKQAVFQSFPAIDKEVTASADDLNTLTDAAGTGALVPTGVISMFAAATIPNGYLACDGVAIPVEFAALIALIGANTPDLRGQFMRGVSDAVDQDPDAPRAPLSTQADEFAAHTHGVFGDTNDGASTSFDRGNTAGTVTSQTDSQGGDETRPKNTAVQFIIKW